MRRLHRLSLAQAGRSWADGVRLGLRLLPHDARLGTKRLVLPSSYWRTAEGSYVMDRLAGLAPGGIVLDIGSPKEIAFRVAVGLGAKVWATDILDSAVAQAASYGRALGRPLIIAEKEDGRALTYPDNFADAAICISVLEHIPGGGDGEAIAEMIRVVRPGGVIVVTTPFDCEYRETHVARSVYDRERTGEELVFYQRHYDLTSLRARLLEVPGAELVDLQFWGEGTLRIERLLDRIGRFRALLSPLEAGLAWLGLRRLPGPDVGHPMAVFFTLRKMVVPTAPASS